MGFLGGYGHAFHSMSEVFFREKGSKVEWLVDMGDAFNPIAIEVLVRMLERWARVQTWRDGAVADVGVPIDAVVIGGDLRDAQG